MRPRPVFPLDSEKETDPVSVPSASRVKIVSRRGPASTPNVPSVFAHDPCFVHPLGVPGSVLAVECPDTMTATSRSPAATVG